MTLLACIPITGSVTLAEVAACSPDTPAQTFDLKAGTQLVVEDDGGDDILILYEASRGVQHKVHSAFGPAVNIDNPGVLYPFTFNAICMIGEILTEAINDFGVGVSCLIWANPPANTTGYFFAGDYEVYVKSTNSSDMAGIVGQYGGAFHEGAGRVGNVMGLEFFASVIGDGASDYLSGIYVQVDTGGAADVTWMSGLDTRLTHNGSGNIPQQIGVYVVSIQSTGGGTIDDGYGVFVEASAGAGITNGYGVFVGDQTAATNNWAIKTGAGDVEFGDKAKFDANATAGNTRLLVWDVDNGTLERVSVGVADSGGAGFKLLRIAN